MTWAAIVALLAAALVFAGCATKPPNYLCRIAINPAGETALMCVPTPATPKDGAT